MHEEVVQHFIPLLFERGAKDLLHHLLFELQAVFGHLHQVYAFSLGERRCWRFLGLLNNLHFLVHHVD